MPYDIEEHRHRFSVWAAARAAQRGFSNVSTLRTALEACGVRKFLVGADLDDIDAKRFDTLHCQWCMKIVSSLEGARKLNIKFGRAAKLIAMYLKSVVILGPASGTAFARIAHPPIDSILLKKLAASGDVKSEHKRKWAKTRWTKLNKDQYDELIAQLRQALGLDEPFWMLERFWNEASDAVF